MYTIREAAARAGVSVSTLRAWERRYGVVSPARSAASYRLYSTEEIETLRRMRRLVASGWSPSLAATALRGGDPVALASSAAEVGSPSLSAAAADAAIRRDEAQRLVEAFTDAAIELDQDGVAAALDEMLARGSFERVASDLVLPALRSLGDAWAAGRLSVAGEHAASHAVLRRLAGAFEAAGNPARPGRPVVVALPPGGRHELGALAFAIVARRAGLPVAYLGADLPLDDWRSATESADAAVIGVPTEADVDAAIAIARRLRRSRPELIVAVGGSAAPTLPGVVHLPDNITEAVAALTAALPRRGRGA
jgi:MerR family transcriptional regulator, light-induced transcriptional regulator